MDDNFMPIQPAPNNENPFMGNNEDNQWVIDPSKQENPLENYEKKEELRKPVVKPVEKKIETPKQVASVFSGAYKTAKTKDLSFRMGKTGAWKDYSTIANREVREKLLKIRDDFFPKNSTYVKQRDIEIKKTQLERKMSYMSGNDLVAAKTFLKEIDEKLK